MKPELFNCLKNGYQKKYLVNDLLAGLLVAIIALPLSIALGIQSGSTLQAGIITAVIAGFLISALGGSRFQIGGPTAAFVVILVGYLGDPEIGVAGLQLIAIMAGVLLIVLGFCKVGSFVRFVPYPIVVGFTTGIGITLIIGQLKDFLGLTVTGPTSNFIEKIGSTFGAIGSANLWSLLVGALTLAVIIVLPKLCKKIPAAFVAVVFATLLTLLINGVTGGAANIATIYSQYGDVQVEFPFMDFAGVKNVNFVKLIVPTFVIAFLCAIESLLSATVADGMADTKHNPNQELIGQGVANIASPLFGGLPATGAIARTAANINAGAKSPLAGVFHAVILLLMYLVLMPLIKYVPMTALAAVLISVAVRMCNFTLFYRMTSVTTRDCIIMLVACILTIFFDLTYGVLGGFVLAILLNIPCMVKKAKIELVKIDEVEGSEKYKDETHKHAIQITGKIYFINVDKLMKLIANQMEVCDELILDCSKMESIDMSSVERLAKTAKAYSKKDKRLVMHCAPEKIHTRYEKAFMHIIKYW